MIGTTTKTSKMKLKSKRRGVLALSLLLIAAMILPQAVLATDSSAGVQTVALAAPSEAVSVEISTDTLLENSGGGGSQI